MRPSFGNVSPGAALFLLLAAANTAHACTVCDSAAGRNLRSGIFDGHFVRNLAVVLSPFPLFVIAAVAVPATVERFCTTGQPNRTEDA